MNDEEEFSKEQQELMEKVTLIIEPAFNGEFVITTETQSGELMGRFNATDIDTMLGAVRAAYTSVDGPGQFEIN
jgi:hypothetical protein